MNPKVFISYCWTSEDYKVFVKKIADELINTGVDVTIDIYDLRAGQDRFAFMEKAIENADKVLILCDKKYAEKANDRQGGVGTETAIITPEVYGHHDQEKFIPVIIDGFDYMPIYLRSRIGIDLRDYDKGFEELLRTIYNKPEHVKPSIGNPPKWVNDEGLIPPAGKGYIARQKDKITPQKIKVCVKAWKEIYSPTGLIDDENALRALDGIMYGPVHEVDEITSEVEEKMIKEFRKIYPEFQFDKYEMHTDESLYIR